MPEVMGRIREELGPEAVILHAKQSRPRGPLGMVRGGGVEILAAVDRGAFSALAGDAPVRAGAARSADSLQAEVATVRNLLVQFGGGRLLPPALGPYYERLVAGGVEPSVALRLLADVPAPSREESGTASAEGAVAESIARMIRTEDEVGVVGPGRVVLVGPAGAGKTTTLAKLAARAQISGGRTAILNLDEGGFGAPSALEAFAAILDVPYAPAPTPEDVAAELRRSPAGGLTLIDTPGLGLGDGVELARLGARLRAARAEQVHLVLPATSKTDDALAAVRAFSALSLTHLLFTRLDETTSCGSVLTVSIETGLPLSYFATGREIPADLAPAAAGEVVNRTLTQRGHRA